MIRKRTRGRAGFTLVEMLVVIAIIGILAGLILAALSSLRISAKERAARATMARIAHAIDQYKEMYDQGYPLSWKVSDVTEMTNALIVQMLVYDNINLRKLENMTKNAALMGNPKLRRGTLLPQLRKYDLNENGEIIDPWGMPYVIIIDRIADSLDADGDQVWVVRSQDDLLQNDKVRALKAAVLIYSFGGDRESDLGYSAKDLARDPTLQNPLLQITGDSGPEQLDDVTLEN